MAGSAGEMVITDMMVRLLTNSTVSFSAPVLPGIVNMKHEPGNFTVPI
jgi:hypothetical protein